MKKEKVINQAGLPNNNFIIVDYFKTIDTTMNTPCNDLEYIKSYSSIGVWKVKSLKN